MGELLRDLKAKSCGVSEEFKKVSGGFQVHFKGAAGSFREGLYEDSGRDLKTVSMRFTCKSVLVGEGLRAGGSVKHKRTAEGFHMGLEDF